MRPLSRARNPTLPHRAAGSPAGRTADRIGPALARFPHAHEIEVLGLAGFKNPILLAGDAVE